MKPTKKPGWNPQDATKIIEPSAQKRLEGWAPGEKPKAEHFNFLVQNISEWIEHLDSTALPDLDAIQVALDAKISEAEIGVSVAPLTGGKIPSSYLPNLALTSVTVVQTLLERDGLAQAGTVQSGDAVKVVQAVQAADGSYLPRTFLFDGTSFVLISSDSDVDSVQGKTGVVTLLASDIPEAADSRYFTEARELAVQAYADAAVSAEAVLRQAADAEIEEAFVSADSALATSLTSAYQAADAALSTTLTSAYQAADVAVTSAYQAADVLLSETLTEAYEAADSAFSAALTEAFEAADTALSASLTSAYQAADTALSASLTSAYEAADAVVTSAYQAADTALSATLTSAYEAADAVVTSAYQAADTALSATLTSAFEAADTALSATLTSAYQAADTAKLAEAKSYTDAEILENVTDKLGVANGIATLGSDGKVPADQLPAASGGGLDTATVRRFELSVNGPYYVNGITSGNDAILFTEIPYKMAVTSAPLRVFLAGTSGSLEVNVEYSTDSGSTWTSLYTTKPVAAFGAGNFATDAGVLTAQSITLSGGTLLRLNLSQVQQGADGFSVNLVHTQVA